MLEYIHNGFHHESPDELIRAQSWAFACFNSWGVGWGEEGRGRVLAFEDGDGDNEGRQGICDSLEMVVWSMWRWEAELARNPSARKHGTLRVGGGKHLDAKPLYLWSQTVQRLCYQGQ